MEAACDTCAVLFGGPPLAGAALQAMTCLLLSMLQATQLVKAAAEEQRREELQQQIRQAQLTEVMICIA